MRLIWCPICKVLISPLFSTLLQSFLVTWYFCFHILEIFHIPYSTFIKKSRKIKNIPGKRGACVECETGCPSIPAEAAMIIKNHSENNRRLPSKLVLIERWVFTKLLLFVLFLEKLQYNAIVLWTCYRSLLLSITYILQTDFVPFEAM